MGIVDLVIIICFLPCIYFGIKNGLVKQIVSICVIFFGIKLSIMFSAPVSEWLAQHINLSGNAVKAISFAVIFFAVAIILSLLGKVVEKILQITLLGWLNRLLGVVLSFFFFLLLLSVVAYFVDSANNFLHFIPADKLSESKFFPELVKFSKMIFPYFKELF